MIIITTINEDDINSLINISKMQMEATLSYLKHELQLDKTKFDFQFPFAVRSQV